MNYLKTILSIRSTYSFAAITCIGLLVFALYLQYFDHLEPCPLCVVQRLVFVGLMLIFGVASLHRSAGRLSHRIYSVLIFTFSLLGMITAGRQIYLQHLPIEKVPGCGPGLNYMLENLPFWNVLQLVFKGSGECAKIVWSWMGFSIPDWSFLFFMLFGLLAIINWARSRNSFA